jgi:FkbM family methyltransferase
MSSLLRPAVLLAVACLGAGAAPGDQPQLPGPKLYSQHDEERIVRHFFKDRREGVFLDVGCASPIKDNNTYYLEKHLGWSGVAVDGLAEFAEPWKTKRPKSVFVNRLVSDHSDTVEAFYRSEHRGTSAATLPEDGVMKGPGGKAVAFEKLEVPTSTLDRILEEKGITKVDFVSLDIEGYEPMALAGFDIERFRPALLCVESKPKNRQVLLDYFAKHGYRRLDEYLAADPVNWYFAPVAR